MEKLELELCQILLKKLIINFVHSTSFGEGYDQFTRKNVFLVAVQKIIDA